MAKNVSFTYYDSAHKTDRYAELPMADFDGGANYGINSLIGICTGFFDFLAQSFSYIDQAYVQGQYIGHATVGTAIVIEDFTVGGSSQFVIAPADTAPGDGFYTGLINKTGELVPAGSRAFGVRA